MKTLSLLSAALVAASSLSGCQLIPSELLSLETRAIVVQEANGNLDGLGQEDVDLTGFGVHGAVMTGIVDVVAGIEQRQFGSSGTPELDIGLRKRIFGIWKLQPFVEANFRYGFDLDTRTRSEDYFGYNVGFGALLDINGTYFLNVRAMYDNTSIDVADGGVDVDGVIGTVGIGIKF